MKTAKEILRAKIIEQCTDDYDGNFRFYENAVIESMEAYASQFRPSSEAIKAAMEQAFDAGQVRGAEKNGSTAGWLGCKLQSKTFDEWYDENCDRIAGELSGDNTCKFPCLDYLHGQERCAIQCENCKP